MVSAGARAEDTLEKVKKRGVIVAGVLEEAPPFSFLEAGSNRIVGHDVDFVSVLATKLGVKLELRAVTLANRLSELVDGNIDILAANLTRSPSHTRESVIDLSDLYVTTGQKFLAKRGTIKTLKDLWGKKIGAVVGTSSENCARDRCAGGTIIPFDDYAHGILALQKGEIDAFTSDQVILVELLASLPRGDFEIPEPQLSEQQYHLGVRKGDKNFLDFVNNTIREMQQSGQTQTIKDKWFQPKQEPSLAAYGAVIRKASVRPRLLALRLKGILLPKADVGIFAFDGTYLGKGSIVSVSEDELYVDVEDAQYDMVRPGFLVAQNMSNELARDVAMRHQELLKTVNADSDKEEARLNAETEREGIAQEKRAQEIDMMRERSTLSVLEERALFFRGR
jgi:polar amino acid transport system substrate-binding protein